MSIVRKLPRGFFADEIRTTRGIVGRKAQVGKRELEMALDLIDRFRSPFRPEAYEDTYRKALLALIERKREGEEVHAEPRTKEGEPVDLLEALRASVEAHSRKPKRPTPRKRPARKRSSSRRGSPTRKA